MSPSTESIFIDSDLFLFRSVRLVMEAGAAFGWCNNLHAQLNKGAVSWEISLLFLALITFV